MHSAKKLWFKIPAQIRKPIVLTIGMLFVIASALTGWLPGPGGIPLFLIGVTILATEFKWAERVRDGILALITRIGTWLRRNPTLGAGLISFGIVGGVCLLYFYFFR